MRRPKTLPPIRPNAGITAAYRRKLRALSEEMARSYEHWIAAQWRSRPPAMAADSSASELAAELAKLGKRWQRRFDEAAPKLAKWFLQSVKGRSERALMALLKEGGWTVKFTMTAEMRDAVDAIVAENVSLIKSIPQTYHAKVEGIVMRSVTVGRDLQQLNRDLRKEFDVTDRRAKFIALDQSNKATSALRRVRETNLGITKGIWLHSHAGKEPRPTHVANDGKEFDLKEGWFDPDPKVRRRILPGFLPRCRCTWRVVVPGFT